MFGKLWEMIRRRQWPSPDVSPTHAVEIAQARQTQDAIRREIINLELRVISRRREGDLGRQR